MRKAKVLMILLLSIVCLSIYTAFSENQSSRPDRVVTLSGWDISDPVNARGEPATYANVKYGDHQRNVFDIWLAKSEKPTPLVIFIHGGGFVGGDKSKGWKFKEVLDFLDNGVSFATINYRYYTQDSRGIIASMKDSKRCLQFIRSKSTEWNIDKSRVVCYGASAGAGTSLWLAFHHEMADPNNPDPVLRESTRLTCAGARGAQATYDILQWHKVLNVDSTSETYTEDRLKEIAGIFGLSSTSELDSPKAKAIRAELDFLNQMSPDDPPFWIYNAMSGGSLKNRPHIEHYPYHAKALLERARQIGVEAVVWAPKIGIRPVSEEDMVAFFFRHLGVEW
jgi:hypothetical protein